MGREGKRERKTLHFIHATFFYFFTSLIMSRVRFSISAHNGRGLCEWRSNTSTVPPCQNLLPFHKPRRRLSELLDVCEDVVLNTRRKRPKLAEKTLHPTYHVALALWSRPPESSPPEDHLRTSASGVSLMTCLAWNLAAHSGRYPCALEGFRVCERDKTVEIRTTIKDKAGKLKSRRRYLEE